MNILAEVSIEQCMKFYSIQDAQVPTEIGADQDFFVGVNKAVTWKIPNGQVIQVKDIVVFGNLTLESANKDHSVEKGTLIARNVFWPGNVEMNYINLKCNYLYQPKNVQQFKEELQDILINWFTWQKESADKIGLKSILIGNS